MGGKIVRVLLMIRIVLFVLSIVVAGFVAGFVAFAISATTVQETVTRDADAIVVLTGGEERISVALGLLRQGAGKRLLISGVNPRTSAGAIRDQAGEERQLFECCVDIGREASDTAGNAEETREWAEARNYRALVVVTSSYHMPRALAEFTRIMPEARFIAHPVFSRHVRDHPWWQTPATLRLLMGEYVKFVAAWTRLGVARVYAMLGMGLGQATTLAR